MPIVVLIIVAFVLYLIFGKKKSAPPMYPPNSNPVIKSNPTSNGGASITTVANNAGSTNKKDNSIIDVTGDSYYLNRPTSLKKYSPGVPLWAHHYVYSYSEIRGANIAQRQFYEVFKNSFLQGEYLDLAGNLNYAFILLFDLLQEYEIHRDIKRLEHQLAALGVCYPKTKSYGISFLIEKMIACGDQEGVLRLKPPTRVEYASYSYEPDYWKLGSKYKAKLGLNDEEVILLNKLWNNSNAFTSIEYCYLQIMKLYLATIKGLQSKYNEEGTSLNEQFSAVADLVARKHFKYRKGSSNYQYCIESTSNGFYSTIFKYCENTVRETYGHKRKISVDTDFLNSSTNLDFEEKILSKVTQILPTLSITIPAPDDLTELELNSQNTARWKLKFEALTSAFAGNSNQFLEDILQLGKANAKNPSIENIFFEASKFISKYDKETALALYVHYLYHDLKSATFDNRQLTKTIQKNLFKTAEQLAEFTAVVNKLIADKNLDKALEGVKNIYLVKRKKIQLDTTAIKEVQQHHSGTVKLLNEYLKDDKEEIQALNAGGSSEEVSITFTQDRIGTQASPYSTNISFTSLHIEALEVFTKGNFSVPQSDLEAFAKAKGVFKNQLIDSINEICFDDLDDVLIEEEEDYYTINPNYYQRLLTV
ncbi:MAG: tellurite resistance TerB C-terminal domain-containing protein [Chitinophagales bacterium]|nr:tellurite resistance TerB C-terminal domain-containing protein [Chitinophagales bacterium]